MDYATLKRAYADWLATSPDPATDAAFLAWINAEQTSLGQVASSWLLSWAVTRDIHTRMQRIIDDVALAGAQASNDQRNQRAALLGIRLLIERDGTSLDLANPAEIAKVDELVAGGLITADDKAALIAKGTSSTTRAATYALGVVGQPHLDRARLDGVIS